MKASPYHWMSRQPFRRYRSQPRVSWIKVLVYSGADVPHGSYKLQAGDKDHGTAIESHISSEIGLLHGANITGPGGGDPPKARLLRFWILSSK
jgi:hypothetical protein